MPKAYDFGLSHSLASAEYSDPMTTKSSINTCASLERRLIGVKGVEEGDHIFHLEGY